MQYGEKDSERRTALRLKKTKHSTENKGYVCSILIFKHFGFSQFVERKGQVTFWKGKKISKGRKISRKILWLASTLQENKVLLIETLKGQRVQFVYFRLTILSYNPVFTQARIALTCCLTAALAKLPCCSSAHTNTWNLTPQRKIK